jgi:hypothetical protein
MKKHFIIFLAISSFILSIVTLLEVGAFIDDTSTSDLETWAYNNQNVIDDYLEIEDKRWEMLKDYLGVVEWTEVIDNDNKCHLNQLTQKLTCGANATIGLNSFLSNDKNKVKWIELKCDILKNKCQELNDKNILCFKSCPNENTILGAKMSEEERQNCENEIINPFDYKECLKLNELINK